MGPAERGSTAPVSGLSGTSPAGTQIGDLVIVVTWEQTGAGVPTHTLQSGFTEIFSQAHDDGSTDGRLSAAYKVATSAGANSYQAYTSDNGTTVFTGIYVVTAGTYDIAGIAAASASSTSNAAPDPPAVTVDPDTDYLSLGIGGWHLTAATTSTITAGSSYVLIWDVAGSAASEVALERRVFVCNESTTIDASAFGDNVNPNGTARAQIVIPVATPSDGYYVKKIDSDQLGTTGPCILTVPAGGVAAGNLLVVAAGQATNGGVSSVTDSKGNTYTVDVTGSTENVGTSLASCVVDTALDAGDTITVNFSGIGIVTLAVAYEFETGDPDLVFTGAERTSSGSGTSTTPSSGATAATTIPDQIVVGAFGYVNGDQEPGSGYTRLSGVSRSGAGHRLQAEYKVVSGTGAQTADGTLSSSVAWNAVVATYKMQSAVTQGSASFSSAPSLSASGTRKVLGVAGLNSGTPALTATALRKVVGAALLTSSGALTALGVRTVSGVASFSAEGVLVVTASAVSVGSVIGIFDLEDGTLIAAFSVPVRSLDLANPVRTLHFAEAVRQAGYDVPTGRVDF